MVVVPPLSMTRGDPGIAAGCAMRSVGGLVVTVYTVRMVSGTSWLLESAEAGCAVYVRMCGGGYKGML